MKSLVQTDREQDVQERIAKELMSFQFYSSHSEKYLLNSIEQGGLIGRYKLTDEDLKAIVFAYANSPYFDDSKKIKWFKKALDPNE